MKIDSEEVMDEISFEELMLLRLTYEINKSTRHHRTIEYNEQLDELTPEFEFYKAVFDALLQLKISPKDGTEKNSLESRALLGEWVKFSLQLATREEQTRKSLIRLIFDTIAKVEYSFADYEHLLRSKKQLLSKDKMVG